MSGDNSRFTFDRKHHYRGVLMQQGRVELGQKALREAIEIHPWLKERSMLIPDPKPEGTDI